MYLVNNLSTGAEPIHVICFDFENYSFCSIVLHPICIIFTICKRKQISLTCHVIYAGVKEVHVYFNLTCLLKEYIFWDPGIGSQNAC